VPAANLLGGPAQLNRGFICLMEQLPWERLQIAITAVAAAQAAACGPWKRRITGETGALAKGHMMASSPA
jgi:hypothetical protein